MDPLETQRLLSEARSAQQRARAVLDGLVESKGRRPATDALRRATGRSGAEHAIAQTRRIIETLDRSIAELERRLPQGQRMALPVSVTQDAALQTERGALAGG